MDKEELGEPAPIFQYEGAPLYVRALEWINAPIDMFPEARGTRSGRSRS